VPEVISDTSPLQYLHQADLLDLLPALYGTILVPEGVAEEIDEGRALGHSLPDLAVLDWIEVTVVPDRRILLLATELGKGEREVLSLALLRPSAKALLDDALARRMASHLGVTYTGTLGVLLRAKSNGHLKEVRPAIDRIETMGFRLDSRTRGHVLRLAGES
jgi:hypothetical protein